MHSPSRKTRAGLVTSSTPTDVRFRSPPDMPLMRAPPTMVSAQCSSPSSWIIRLVSRSKSRSVVDRGSRSLAEKRMASRGVEVTWRLSSCATKAICFRTESLVGSTS